MATVAALAIENVTVMGTVMLTAIVRLQLMSPQVLTHRSRSVTRFNSSPDVTID